ncbi:heterodisulfide reductase-related iron-sulfur binding cluster [Mesorhizobium atlanticum]
MLERLAQKSASVSMPAEPADFVFYTGCNVLKTPHIALLALDIMDVLGVSYQVMGGPSHCCGIVQLKSGDAEMSGRMGSSSMEKLSHSTSGQVITRCPTCYVQFTETILPTVERQRGSRPFEMNPFLRFLGERLRQLKPHLQHRVDMRVALHKHPGVAGIVEAATEILKMVPGISLIDLNQPAVGLQSVHVGALPRFKRELQLRELEAARAAGVDALVAVYHSDHRELCAHERDWPFRIINILEVVGESMGLHRHDRYKELKVMQDADQIVDECRDLITKHSLDPQDARDVVVRVLLGEQPLPLKVSGRGENVVATRLECRRPRKRVISRSPVMQHASDLLALGGDLLTACRRRPREGSLKSCHRPASARLLLRPRGSCALHEPDPIVVGLGAAKIE